VYQNTREGTRTVTVNPTIVEHVTATPIEPAAPTVAEIVAAIQAAHRPGEWWTPNRTRVVCTGPHGHHVAHPCRTVQWANQQTGNPERGNIHG